MNWNNIDSVYTKRVIRIGIRLKRKQKIKKIFNVNKHRR